MDKKNIILVEDDFLNRRYTKKILTENGYHVLESKNAIETMALLKTHTPDLIILDIHLGETDKNGINLAQDIKELFNIPFLFLTAYSATDVVEKAIATLPQSYITKPFKNIDLITAVELAIRQFNNQEKRKPVVVIKEVGFNIELPIEEIDYIESDGNYLLIYAQEKMYKSRFTIKQILEILPATSFVQTHRAYIVNKNKIEKYNTKNVIVNNNEIPVSKNYIDDIKVFEKMRNIYT